MTNQLTADVTMLTAADSGRRRSVPEFSVVHTNEGPPMAPVENLLRYMQDVSNEASYTIVVGGDGRIGRSNDDDYVPWAAGFTANTRGLHLCFQGFAADSRAAWLARPKQLAAGARVLADWSRRYNIPPIWLTAAALRSRHRGVCGHDTTAAAWHETSHTDPGPGFPTERLLELVMDELEGTNKKDDDMAFTDEDRRKLDYIFRQLGTWPQLGQNDKGQNLTPVDALAELKARGE